MKMMKKTLAILLALIMISSSFVCFAAELNQDAVAAHKGQYKNYVLLGDSVASGYRDQMNEYDELFNELYMDSTYCRYEGSYADVLADAIIDEENGGTMTALAAPGFRTVEMRYMLEDDFAATCTDEYLFHPSHLYIYEDQYCEECGEFLLPGAEHFRKEFKKAIAEADLITLGLGGNDWGAYLGWVINDVMKKEHVPAEYMEMANKVIEEGTMDIATVEKLVEIANMAGLVNELLQTVPAALEYGLAGFYSNWDIVIQDIYDLNPDVTLMVVGMSDNGLKGNYYDYPEYGIVGGPVNGEDTQTGGTNELMSIIIGFIMSIGNKPLIDGVEKFGYTYVDTDGTTYVDSHPDAAGHVNIANKIIEALPDATVSKQFDDVKPGNKYYNAVEFVVLNGIMDGTSENKFSPDEAITKGQLEAAKNAICGTNYATDNTAKANLLDFIFALIKCGLKSGLTGFIKSFSIMYNLIYDNNLNLGASITRADAAVYFYTICK